MDLELKSNEELEKIISIAENILRERYLDREYALHMQNMMQLYERDICDE